MFSKTELQTIETSIYCNINRTIKKINDLKEDLDYWSSSSEQHKDIYIKDDKERLSDENEYLSELMILKDKIKSLLTE